MLTTIVDSVPVTLDTEASRFWRYDRERVVELLRELEFSSVVARVPNPADAGAASAGAAAQSAQGALIPASEEPKGDYRIVDSSAALEAMVSELRGLRQFCVRHGDHGPRPDGIAAGRAVVLLRERRGVLRAGGPRRGRTAIHRGGAERTPAAAGRPGGRQGGAQRQLRHDRARQLRHQRPRHGFRHDGRRAPAGREGTWPQEPGVQQAERGDDQYRRAHRHWPQAEDDGAGSRAGRRGLRGRGRRHDAAAARPVRPAAGAGGQAGVRVRRGGDAAGARARADAAQRRFAGRRAASPHGGRAGRAAVPGGGRRC